MIFSKEDLDQEIKRWQNRLVKNCKDCEGSGSVSKQGTNKAVMCDCQNRALSNSYLVASGIPRKYLDENWNWENINCNKDSIDKVRKYVGTFVQNYYAGKWLYIYGRQGRGKSLLESLSARDIIKKINPDTDRHFKVAFIIFEEMVQLSHEARNDSISRKRYNAIIENTDLLIIDNIGSETGTVPYNSKVLEYILRKRDNNCMPTIISSNFTPEQIKNHYSDTIHDFIVQNSELVLVEGENYRQKGNVFEDDFEKDFFEDGKE
jgi:DNA replication protein DnaC